MGAPPPQFRKPSFLEGFSPRPSQPANFTSAPRPFTPPHHHPERSAAESKEVPFAPPDITAPLPDAHPSTPPLQGYAQDEAVAPSEAEAPSLDVPAPRPVPPRPAFLPDGVAERLAHAIEALKLQNDKLAEMARGDALEIGFIIAERILEQEVQSNPRVLLSLVRTAMRRLAESRELVIYLSPGDVEKVRAKIAEGGPDVTGLSGVKLAADQALMPGDCRVQSELGSVDGKLSTRLNEIRRSVAEGDKP